MGDDALNLPDQRLVEQVQRHEGLRLEAYLCPAGKITIGYGHNLQANPVPGIPAIVGTKITQDQAQRLLVADLMETRRKVLERFPWAADLAPARLAVLVNMAFNLGITGLAAFSRTLAHVAAGQYAEASTEMLASLWAKQVGNRAKELSRQMRTGEWVEV